MQLVEQKLFKLTLTSLKINTENWLCSECFCGTHSKTFTNHVKQNKIDVACCLNKKKK